MGDFFIATFDIIWLPESISHHPMGFWEVVVADFREKSHGLSQNRTMGILLAFGWVVGRCTRNGVNPFELVKVPV